MIDLEREVKEAFKKLAKENDMPINKYWCDDGTDNQYEDPETSDAYNFYRDGWNKRAELAQAEITDLKKSSKNLKVVSLFWCREKPTNKWRVHFGIIGLVIQDNKQWFLLGEP